LHDQYAIQKRKRRKRNKIKKSQLVSNQISLPYTSHSKRKKMLRRIKWCGKSLISITIISRMRRLKAVERLTRVSSFFFTSTKTKIPLWLNNNNKIKKKLYEITTKPLKSKLEKTKMPLEINNNSKKTIKR
jgi:hypothetical protein